jgi:hypothetical protein
VSLRLNENFLLSALTQEQILLKYVEYISRVEAEEENTHRSALFKPVMNLFHGLNNSKYFRASLSGANVKGSGRKATDVILRAYDNMLRGDLKCEA